MKKLLIVLSVFLITFSACSQSNYSKVVEDITIYFEEYADGNDMDTFDFGAYTPDVISGTNDLFTYTGSDFRIKNMYAFWIASEDEHSGIDIVEYQGDIEDLLELYDASIYCEIYDDVVFLDYSENLEELCDELDGKYYD